MIQPTNCGQISFSGMRSHCVGYAADGIGVVYLSMVGFKTANKALWAALLEKRNLLEIGGKSFMRLDTPYQRIETQMPEIGMTNMILVNNQATTLNLPEKDFYVFGDMAEKETLQQFGAMLNRAISVPLLDEWHKDLFALGLEEKLIVLLHATNGIKCFRVSGSNERWQKHLSIWIRGNRAASPQL